MTEGEGLAQSEGASGKLIDQRPGNVKRQVPGRDFSFFFMQASRLLNLHLTGNYSEQEFFSHRYN